LISNKSTAPLISNTLILSGAISGAYGFIQSIGLDPVDWTTEYTPVFGFSGNPNFQSAFMALTASAAIIMIFESKNYRKNIALFLIIVLSIYNIYKTKSQQGFLILLVIILIGFYLLLRNKFRSVFYDLAFITIISSALIFILLDLFRKTPWKSFLYENSVSYRGDFWRAGWRMFIDNSVLGVGPGGFRDNYMRYRDVIAATRPNVDTITDSPHNYFINIASTGGLPLLIAYILINVLVMIKIIKLFKLQTGISHHLIVIIICWVGFSIQSIISIENLSLSVWGWALAGFIIGYKIEYKNEFEFKDNKRHLSLTVLVTFALALTILQFKNDANFRTSVKESNILGIQRSALSWPQDANRMNFVAKILRENGFEVEALEVARKAVKINPENVESWREFSKFQSITIDEKELAERKITALDPWGVYP
jgi:hypothetical protein